MFPIKADDLVRTDIPDSFPREDKILDAVRAELLRYRFSNPTYYHATIPTPETFEERVRRKVKEKWGDDDDAEG